MNKERAEEIIKKYETDTALFNWCDEYKKYVSDNVLSCVSSEWDYILKKSFEDSEAPFSYEDYDLFYYDEDELRETILEELTNKEDITDKLEFLNCFDEDLKYNNIEETTKREDFNSIWEENLRNHLIDLDIDELKNLIENDIDHLISFSLDEYEHNTEVFEWWIVSYSLSVDLEENDQIVLSGAWGRQTTGQSISLDYCIRQIYIKNLKLNLKYL